MVNWKTTATGIASIILAGLVQLNYLTAAQATVITGIIVGILGFVSKDNNVTGGSVPQASPPGVANKSDALGVIAAVDAMTVKSFSEERAKATAEDVVATSVSPTAVNLNK